MKYLVNVVLLTSYSNAFNLLNPIITGTSLASSYGLVKVLNDAPLDVNVTRKIVHIVSGPMFLSTWNLYDDNNAIFWAAMVPILSSACLAIRSDKFTNVLSRTGENNEIVKGPLIYTLMLSAVTVLFWNNPAGMIGIIQLAIGDGFSDIIGRKFGKTAWYHNSDKSVEGSLGFLITSFIGSALLLNDKYDSIGVNELIKVFIISLVCSLVETAPDMDDNIWVPLAGILGYDLLFT